MQNESDRVSVASVILGTTCLQRWTKIYEICVCRPFVIFTLHRGLTMSLTKT